MSRDSEYEQRHFLAEKSKQAKGEQIDLELRTLRKQVQILEQKVSSLTTELSMRKVIGQNRREFS